jgi:hypothetical protein
VRPSVTTALLAFGSTVVGGAANPSFPALQTFTVPLSGVAEANFAHPAGGTGDPDGSGTVKLVITPGDRQVCYDLSLSNLAEPVMAHILRAPRLKNGPPIVALFTGPGSAMDACVTANTGQLAEMIAHPTDFYVSVATTEYPDGALRGQLSEPSD